ncbi:DNA-directed RNA polymerase, beta' subunit [Aedoeadaptatus nemausensis]|uniref:DNA-directed RNA polymerase subunit beta' n=1 Tax=Aedoeadaptatus nemausensis TaxID=2582829 RepID=A0A6V6Y3J5_9FIRM|nr:DNA-directed RNA polymerase subunit beta' [Peptoniphilus nemausensis]CAC9931162.1 DNA-directed RNA polymerase, beta' subunit [Peptoniphilus nemausensis]
MSRNELFHSIKIGLASSEKIRSWSYGEVKKPETINYRTLKPEKEGLFCEKIFGPTKDWECSCGKYKRLRYKGVVCEKCGVEVTKSKVRRERMGHIELAAPVSHIWYFKGIPSRMGLVLDVSPRALEKVLYFASYIVTRVDDDVTEIYEKQLLSETEYREFKRDYGNKFEAKMGAEAIRDILRNIDLDEIAKELRDQLEDASGQKRVRITRRLEVIEAFRSSGNKCEWMILDCIPVIPPELRPMVQLDGGRFATSDLNDLYRRVINRNNRLRKLMDIGAPEIIVRNEKRMLQESVDALIDNGRRGRPVTGAGNRPLKSLSEMLKGKQGRFRQNLLGKRVDYSGRSVIVVGPSLKFYQCGLPRNMALELFKPFVMRELVERELAHNIKSAKRMVERVRPEVWDVLEEVIKDHPVLLNRAPTLHRLGIQAFEPVLVEGKAIKLHPLACTAYNADFDGDQMAVHLPLSAEAQAEARLLMLSTNNILALKDGKPITTPSQDMVLGLYYLTLDRKDSVKGDGMTFMDTKEMMHAYESGWVHLHSHVKVRRHKDEEDKRGKIVESTVGRFLINEVIPQDLGFVDRKEDPYSLEIDKVIDKKLLGKIIDRCYKLHDNLETAEFLDEVKSLGYHYSTVGAMSISMGDVQIPDEKPEILEQAEADVEKYEKAYRKGLISDEERYEHVIDIWNEATDHLTNKVMDGFGALNNIYIFANSGARGSKNQIRQLAGMRGLMASPSGRTIEVPITSNFREGLDVLEFFMSTHGSRKGLADTALRTADSGYLTRRLVDVSQQVTVTEKDCGTESYIVAKAFKDGREMIEELHDRIEGRTSYEDIRHPETDELIVEAGEMINANAADAITEAGIEEVKIRSVLGCHSEHGVCAKCYGQNLATGRPVGIGEAVGVIAAQSIGEPGTQLTMRTFHTGGVAAAADITQGLPRVEELFEVRKPKGLAIISEIDGTVDIRETAKKREIVVTGDDGTSEAYNVVYGARIRVKPGDRVEKGDELTQGSVYPQDLLRVKGATGVQEYIVKEVQRVYRLQGVDIDDKHIEVIVKQMMSKVRIEEAGGTNLLPGSMVTKIEFERANKAAEAEGLQEATASPTLLGITKASLATDSFLSAASFQETTRVLTDAAIEGKQDYLEGLKENIIIGQLIPAGTGVRQNGTVYWEEEDQRKENLDILEGMNA